MRPWPGTASRTSSYILADDLGYGDVRSYNPKRGKILTPHIDRLASQGMRFSDAHSSSGVCSPSRYTLVGLVSGWPQNGTAERTIRVCPV